MKKVALFCFAHAGGSAGLAYRTWDRWFASGIELVPIDYPGRGIRVSEPPAVSLRALTDDLLDRMRPHLHDGGEFALFGHSLGALAAYELGCRLPAELRGRCRAVIVSGRRPPQLDNGAPHYSELPDERLIEEMMAMGGTPEALLKHPLLTDVILPLLRADLRVLERHVFDGRRKRLRRPLAVFYGLQDQYAHPDVIGMWAECTSAEATFHAFEGGHFYTIAHAQAIGARIGSLLGVLAERGRSDETAKRDLSAQ